ncbi:hypothetical protein HYY72_05415 [Candidatus Woesearchaeota archaeon]|nr:hypothetical protein [Candidatus Woesearchaeota archaeon]
MPSKSQQFMARAIIEIAGKPKKYIEDAMKLVLERLKKEDGIKLLKTKTHEPQQHGDIFSTFAEVELRLEDFDSITFFCFEYLPSSIEFLEPESFKMDSVMMNSVLNDILGRLHQVDLRLKDITAANMMLEKNSYTLLKRSVALILSQGERRVEQISDLVGVVPEQLKPFLERFVKEKFIRRAGDCYSLYDGAFRT